VHFVEVSQKPQHGFVSPHMVAVMTGYDLYLI